ncbi:MAG: 16S rRNA (adenine(1518)-N(6)/adenine(1519)-N(6))-dimethyltransferase RsmA [Syntrophales bacterium]|nr:16S rRNA (adenine(1518)-N(6)/adenine(1519)-N(6))-dimethyltransferase RsmA [Syntrophales bacterium]
MRPKKRLGQHFLKNGNLAAKIVQSAGIEKDDTVVEIGAGTGILTREIVKKTANVVAIEIDPEAVSLLKNDPSMSHISILQGDILLFDLSTFKNKISGKIKVLGNLPYYISSQIFFHLLNHRHVISSAVLMLQKEMADRLVAQPGTKSYGIPSVMANVYSDASILFTVPPSCFYPPPKVHSAVVHIKFYEKPRYNLKNETFFSSLVRLCFSKRRKTLWNNLRILCDENIPEERLRKILEEIGINVNTRAEALKPEQFALMSNILCAFK